MFACEMDSNARSATKPHEDGNKGRKVNDCLQGFRHRQYYMKKQRLS
jgi:hypothetical protein